MRILITAIVTMTLAACTEEVSPDWQKEELPFTGTFISFDEERKPQLSLEYKDGKRDGWSRFWYENGQLEVEAIYKDGRLEGLQRRWYENGQLKIERPFKEGKAEGVTRRWHEDGQFHFESCWVNGKGVDMSHCQQVDATES